MSVITLQVGQCGNQIGKSFLDTIYSDLTSLDSLDDEYSNFLLRRFFLENDKPTKKIARSILVDTEHKVVDELMTLANGNNNKWSYSPSCCFRFRGGCGNLWPMGYFKFTSSISDSVCESINRLLESCDSLDSFLIMMSVAGGTGSGLGSFLTQIIRDNFPKSFIVNQLVWPYSSGEVVIQSYNALLTLSHVFPFTDAILNVYNDSIHDICTRLGVSVEITRLNEIITRHLAGILSPANTPQHSPGRLGEMLTHLVPHPSFKLLQLSGAPNTTPETKLFTTEAWTTLLSSVLPRKYKSPPTISDLLFLRGKESLQVDISPFKKHRVYANFIPELMRNQIWYQSRPFLNERRSVFLVSNEQNSLIGSTKEKAWRLFSNKAYVHHLNKHGTSNELLMDAFASVSQIIENYNQIE